MPNLSLSPITRPGTGAVSRTFAARDSDVFNVKDFGARGNWNGTTGNDDTTAIQKALDAAHTNLGGTVYFPAGRYHITSRLTTLPGNVEVVTLLGDGANCEANTGSIIEGNFADYLLYTQKENTQVKLIKGLGFRNLNGYVPFSVEAPNSPDCRTNVFGTVAGTIGRVRLRLVQFAHAFGQVLTILSTGRSTTISGVGGTTEANGTYTITGSGARFTITGPITAGTGGVCRIPLSSTANMIVGDRVEIRGVFAPAPIYVHEVNGERTITAISTNTYIEVNRACDNPGVSTGFGELDNLYIEIPVTWTNAYTSGGSAALNGDGSGCVFYQGLASNIECCDFMWGDSVAGTGGTALYIVSFCNTIVSCTFTGPWKQGVASKTSFGIVGRRYVAVGCSFRNVGVAINSFANSGLTEFCYWLNCGIGVYGGYALMSYIEDEAGLVPIGNVSSSWGLMACHMEDAGEYFILHGTSGGGMRNSMMTSGGSAGVPLAGIGGGSNYCGMESSSITGQFSSAAVDFMAVFQETKTALFDMAELNVTSGGGVKLVIPAGGNYGNAPSRFLNCPGVDGAEPFSSLTAKIPAADAHVKMSYNVMISNAAFPVWDTSGTPKSLAGQNQSGGGSTRGMVHYDGANWVVSG